MLPEPFRLLGDHRSEESLARGVVTMNKNSHIESIGEPFTIDDAPSMLRSGKWVLVPKEEASEKYQLAWKTILDRDKARKARAAKAKAKTRERVKQSELLVIRWLCRSRVFNKDANETIQGIDSQRWLRAWSASDIAGGIVSSPELYPEPEYAWVSEVEETTLADYIRKAKKLPTLAEILNRK